MMVNVLLSLVVIASSLMAFSTNSHAQTWAIDDVGTHSQPSVVTMPSSKSVLIKTNGTDTYDNSTAVIQTITGNAELIARLDTPTTVVPTMRRGLILESSNDPALFLIEADGVMKLTQFQRGGTAATELKSVSRILPTGPIWLKINKVGGKVSAYQSADGTNWQQVGEVINQNWTTAKWGMVAGSGVGSGLTQCEAPFSKIALVTNLPPAAWSKLKLWIKADQGVVYDSSKNVTQWSDQSGQGNHLTQVTSANRPTLTSSTTGILNEMPFVTFGGGKYLSAADNASLKPTSNIRVYTVVRRTSGTGIAIVVEKYTPGGAGYSLQMQTAAGRRFYTNTVTASSSVPAGEAQNFAVVEGYLEVPGRRTLRINGTILDESAVVNSNFGASNNPLYLGGRPSTYPFAGDVAEVLVIGDKLDETEIREMDAYLYSKYGIGTKPSALPPLIDVKSGIYTGT